MSDMTRREFTALIGDLAGARAEIEAIKALRAARRMDAICGPRSAAYCSPHAGRCARNSISVIFAIKRGSRGCGERHETACTCDGGA